MIIIEYVFCDNLQINVKIVRYVKENENFIIITVTKEIKKFVD
jgi:hypothetical protein